MFRKFLLFLLVGLIFPISNQAQPVPTDLVDLHKYTGVEIKNFPYAHPAHIWLIGQIQDKIWRITEAYPTTTRHISKCHSNGRCIDLTLKRKKDAAKVCKYVNSLKDYRCVNEYKKKYSTTTGNHLHIVYLGV